MKLETLLVLLGLGGALWWWLTRPELGPAPVVTPGAAGIAPGEPVRSVPVVKQCQVPCECPAGMMCACASVLDGVSIDGGKCQRWAAVASDDAVVAVLRAECERRGGARALFNSNAGVCEMAVN